MKKSLIYVCLILFISSPILAQHWSNTGNNETTGTVRIGTSIPFTTKQLVVTSNAGDHVAAFDNTSTSGLGVIISAKHDPLRVSSIGTYLGNLLIINGNGTVGINNTSPNAAYKLDVTGNVNVSSNLYSFNLSATNDVSGWSGDFYNLYYNNIYSSSDRNLKRDIREDLDSHNSLYSIKTYNYTYKDDPESRTQHGVMAQDVQQYFPELVVDRGEDGLAVNYTAMIPMLIRAVQDQKQTIDLLQDELNSLKKELSEVKQNNGIVETKEEMILFPNPSSSTTSISFKNTSKTSSAYIEIVNLNGEVIEKVQRTGSQSIQLDNDKLQKGVYFVRYISNGELVETKRMLIEK